MNLTLINILWYLAIGAFFIMMMRNGGCCGGHKKEQKQDSKDNRVEHK
ncbi:hypothetical protein [Geopsychrobacter electrodiphilus]|nr:hypothetical protein [Geopsychrobacter electrodiphilus]